MYASLSETSNYKRIGNINKLLLFQIEKDGVEIKKSSKEDSRVRVSRENPLEKMRDDGKLTRQECAAGQKYQRKFADANKDGYAKPSLLYDGLPDSARSTKPFEATPSDERIDASSYIQEVKRKISYHIYIQLKLHGTRNLKLFEILEYVFEGEKSIRHTEKKIGLNHAFIEQGVKRICEILLKI